MAYLSACLTEHDVQVYDPNVAADPYGELTQRLNRFQPEVVGISLRNIDTTQYRDPYLYLATLRPTLDIVRRALKHVRIVIGGSGFSIYAAALMQRYPELDFGVMLEGEESLPALLRNLEHAESVPGIWHRRNGETRLSAPPQLPDFNALPAPRWDCLDLQPYKGQLDTIGVQAKRGCGLKCAYCTYYFLNGAHYRLRDPEKIAEEILELTGRFQLDHFIFVDSVFNVPQTHAREICEALIRRKLKVPWTAWYNERFFDQDFLRLAREAGCRHFSFSPDAFSDRALERLHKNLRVKDIRKVHELAKREVGATFGFNFFVNPPDRLIPISCA